MKKTATILFIFVFLCGSTELHEFLKLPELLHHFFTSHNNESFSDFLNEHYGNVNHSDDEGHHHERLPFKDGCGTILSFAVSPANTFTFSAKNIAFSVEKKLTNYTSSFVSSAVLNNVWQPPKF